MTTERLACLVGTLALLACSGAPSQHLKGDSLGAVDASEPREDGGPDTESEPGQSDTGADSPSSGDAGTADSSTIEAALDAAVDVPDSAPLPLPEEPDASNCVADDAGAQLNTLSSGAVDLVGHWTFDEASADDSSGYENHGTLHGGTFVAGRVGGTALELNGTSDYVSVPDSPSLNPAYLTLSAWIRPVSYRGLGSDPIIEKSFTSHSPPFYQYQLSLTGDQYGSDRASFNSAVAVNGVARGRAVPGSWVPGTWYHVASTFDRCSHRLYVNGELVASEAVQGTLSRYATPVQFGRYVNVDVYLPGTLDDLRIYGRALSAEEIRGLAQGDQ